MLALVLRMHRHSEYWKQQKECKISFEKNTEWQERGGGGDQHRCVCLGLRLDVNFITTRTVQQ